MTNQSIPDVYAQVLETAWHLQRQLYRKSFKEFVNAAWPHVSSRKLVWGWHLDEICQALQDVADGVNNRLIINVPPRSLKSMLVSVLYPAWVWTRDSSHQFLTVSHSRTLSTRDARYSRNLIQSDWYRDLFPEVVIVSDQNQKMYYETERGGHRNAASVKEGLTGKGGDTVLLDDMLSAEKVTISDNDINRCIEVYEESVEQRLNSPGKSAIIVIMQRLHANDITGWLLKNRARENWVHLCFPLLYEPDHPHVCVKDKRTRAGEILLPERWPKIAIDVVKQKPMVFAGQYQQRPSVRGGNILLRDSWNVWTEANLPEIRYVIMSLDTAFKDGQQNDYSACTVWGLFEATSQADIGGRRPKEKMDAILMHAWKARMRYPELRERIQVEYSKWVKRQMRPDIILIEDKASGQSLIQEFDAAGIPGVTPWPPRVKNSGVHANEPPLFRAQLASEILDDGAVWVPGRMLASGRRDPKILVPWAEEVVAEAEQFPRAEHDDLTTTVIQALRYMRQADLVESSSDVDDVIHDMIGRHTQTEAVYG